MKIVIDASLEQRAILALGWLRKAGRLVAEKKIAAEELPQGLQQKPHEFVKDQSALAHAAVEQMESHVKEISDKAAEAIKGLQQQRAALATAVQTGKKTAQEANKDSQALLVQIEGAGAAIDQAERLLRILHGQEELSLPTLPLFKYAQALERLEGKKNDAPVPDIEKQQKISSHGKIVGAFLRKTDRSDRIALSIAAILCITVIATALYYVVFSGGVDLKITLLPEAALQVQCVNTNYDSIQLHVPYDGNGLPEEPVPQYGLLLELIGEDGNIIRPPALEALWEYKDIPAHLYGPVVVGPMFAVDLSLDLKSYAHEADIKAIRLTLYRAPNRKYKVYEAALSKEFWTLSEETGE